MRLSCISMFRKGKRKYIVFRMFCCFPLLQIIYQIREMHGIEQLEEGYLVHFFFPHVKQTTVWQAMNLQALLQILVHAYFDQSTQLPVGAEWGRYIIVAWISHWP